ncbi:hypothetical protein ALC53_00656 [Atta colombica]|uniref:Uncharacterized protein n=1 Tax=Atta colombica TaxID=520822 RepID=A0A195BVR0_9HYME|nr:hypothetical protein ALC53_00656 [Atta colombica]
MEQHGRRVEQRPAQTIWDLEYRLLGVSWTRNRCSSQVKEPHSPYLSPVCEMRLSATNTALCSSLQENSRSNASRQAASRQAGKQSGKQAVRQASSQASRPDALSSYPSRERIVISPGVNSGRASVSHPLELSRLGVADENLGTEQVGRWRRHDEESRERKKERKRQICDVGREIKSDRQQQRKKDISTLDERERVRRRRSKAADVERVLSAFRERKGKAKGARKVYAGRVK